MGLNTHGIKFLLYSKASGVDFTQTAMIGRQGLHLYKDELKSIFQTFARTITDQQLDKIFTQDNGYAEEFFRQIGAREIHSFDFSDFEKATYIHDFNREIPSEFKERYSVVFDGGSLEHVFNFPVAIKNCMEMVKIGGYYLASTPANNNFGHGFYQFSPELFFDIFVEENGFELVNLIAYEDSPGTIWYKVKSPKEVKARVTLMNNESVYLFIIARRFKRVGIFDSIPQQSDYQMQWNQHEMNLGNSDSGEKKVKGPKFINQFLRAFLDTCPSVKQYLKKIRSKYSRLFRSSFDPKFFKPFDPIKDNKNVLSNNEGNISRK